MSFFTLEVPKEKPIKFIWMMTHVKLSKHMIFRQRNWKTNKNCNSYGLMKTWSNFTIQKSLTIKRLKFSSKIFIIWVYHLVLHHILKPNNKFGMWINIIFFHFVMFHSNDQSIFFDFKSSFLLTNEFFYQ